MKKKVKNANMVKEIRLCWQCALMFVIYTVSWVFYMFIPQESPEWRMVHSLITVLVMGGDALVYLLLNKEMKSQLPPAKEWFSICFPRYAG
ncbi:unnamed protein product [Auanema sp. JU1783]|nr:unnamed protein product [Auanema sp. JU1783]